MPDRLDIDAVPPGVALACVALCLLLWLAFRRALRHYLRHNRED